MSDDWDVDSYKSEFENEEHWQLRRNFMLAHKDKFPEDELVCLAQAFTNVEFMGCRYPDETMVRIAELAKGVVEKFREQRKNSLKRTFVAASEAASAKVKGQTRKSEEESVSSNKVRKIENIEKNSKISEEEIIKGRSSKVDISNSRGLMHGRVNALNTGQDVQFKVYNLDGLYNETDTVNSVNEEKSFVKSEAPLGDFVLILDSEDEHPVTIIQKSSAINKCTIRWDFEEINGSSFACKLFLNNHCIATSNGINMKMSKEHTATVAIAKLRESYYGIRVKSKFFSDTTVTPAQLGSGSNYSSNQLGEGNIGRKLMKLMGWQGGGLGSHEQGRENPIFAPLQVKRDGLGLSPYNSSMMAFKKKAREYIKCWVNSNSDEDLVFSTDFSSEERKMMHIIANTFSLKSKSYGKDSDRRLVISRKCEPWEIVKELLRIGGSSEKYELLYPTKTSKSDLSLSFQKL